MKNILLLLTLITLISACSNQPCKIEERTDIVMTGKEKISSATKDLTQRVFVYRPDGSLQCGQGKKIDLNTMKSEFGKIEVFSAENKHDGMMRIQLCGAPTGFNNVYEIKQSDLDAAIKLGFKKWIRD